MSKLVEKYSILELNEFLTGGSLCVRDPPTCRKNTISRHTLRVRNNKRRKPWDLANCKKMTLNLLKSSEVSFWRF